MKTAIKLMMIAQDSAAIGARLNRRVRPVATNTSKRLTAKQKRMQRVIRFLGNYMGTYEHQQAECLNYTDKILIDDVLYALGIAFEPQHHKYASGYEVWKDRLREHLADGQA